MTGRTPGDGCPYKQFRHIDKYQISVYRSDDHRIPKPPLCKGRCQPNRLTEGLCSKILRICTEFRRIHNISPRQSPSLFRCFAAENPAPFTQGGLLVRCKTERQTSICIDRILKRGALKNAPLLYAVGNRYRNDKSPRLLPLAHWLWVFIFGDGFDSRSAPKAKAPRRVQCVNGEKQDTVVEKIKESMRSRPAWSKAPPEPCI